MIVISEIAWKAIETLNKRLKFKQPALRISSKNKNYFINFEELGERNNDTHIFGPSKCVVVVDENSLDVLRNAILICENLNNEVFKIKDENILITCCYDISYITK